MTAISVTATIRKWLLRCYLVLYLVQDTAIKLVKFVRRSSCTKWIIAEFVVVVATNEQLFLSLCHYAIQNRRRDDDCWLHAGWLARFELSSFSHQCYLLVGVNQMHRRHPMSITAQYLKRCKVRSSETAADRVPGACPKYWGLWQWAKMQVWPKITAISAPRGPRGCCS